MKDQELLTEGDVNFSPSRKDWQASLDGDTRDALQADSAEIGRASCRERV